jgi:photoactive yellow protein
MLESDTVTFDQGGLIASLARASDAGLGRLDFGAIGFDHAGVARRHNAFESKVSGRRCSNARGADMFAAVAPGINNFLVARRFDDARNDGAPLDATIDYVLTLRMRPVRVKRSLLAGQDEQMRFVVLQRSL